LTGTRPALTGTRASCSTARRRAPWQRRRWPGNGRDGKFLFSVPFRCLAASLGVDMHSLRRWLFGDEPVPLAVAQSVMRTIGGRLDSTHWPAGVVGHGHVTQLGAGL
jgi:hypothetical protein